MRLSEAMRLGATLTEQCYHSLREGFKYNNPADPSRTCALGSAGHAVGLLDKYGEDGDVINALGELYQTRENRQYRRNEGFVLDCPHPDCDTTYPGPSLLSVIVHLNDDHRWTREAIADWIDSEGYDYDPAKEADNGKVEGEHRTGVGQSQVPVGFTTVG